MYVLDIFTIVPTTQYVWINQTATFTCATNVTGYTLNFNTIPNANTFTEELPGGGVLAYLTLNVTRENNGTKVRCSADNGTILISADSVYAYTQG